MNSFLFHLIFYLAAHNRNSKICLLSIFISAAFAYSCSDAFAQTWSLRDIGTTGVTGSYSTGSGPPPTYTVSGAGGGIGITNTPDSCAFVSTATSGNIELQGKITSLGSTSSSSMGGFLIRDSFQANFASIASIYLTAGSGVKFTYRVRGSNPVTVNGSASTTPVYLRLTKNGDTYSGYESSDGVSWSLVGSFTQANFIPQLYLAGFVSSSSVAGTNNTAIFSNFSYITSVPQQESSLIGWYRSDAGVTQSSGVSVWADQSGNSNDATQSSASLRPTLVAGAVNNSILPTLSFDGVDDRLILPSNFSDLTNGVSVFVVLKPTSTSGDRTSITVSNASNADAFIAQTNNTNSTMTAYNNATSSAVATSSNPIAVNQFQVLEQIFQPGTTDGIGTISVDGVQAAQATNLISTLRNVTRSNNSIGMSSATTDFFQGEIAEILFYKKALKPTQIASIRSYLLSKFGVGSQPNLDAVVMTPGGGIFAPYQTVTMSQSQDAAIFFSVDGTTPDASGNYPWYNGETLKIPATTTLKATAVKDFFTSTVSSTAYEIDPKTASIPRNGLKLWLMANNGVVLSSGSVSQWINKSGVEGDAIQANPSNRPGFTESAINDIGAVSFNGSSQWLSLPTNSDNFSSGASIFVMLKPTSVSAGAKVLDLGNGATSDNINIQEPTSTGASLYVYSGSSPSSVTSSSAITVGQFQLLESIHNGTSGATISTNAIQGAQSSSMNSITNILRENNFVGQGSAGGNYFNGEIAEILLYNRAVSTLEKSAIEAALINKYQALTAITCPAPIISVATSTLQKPTQVAISSLAGAVTHVTVDGTTPSISSPIYSAPLNIFYGQTVKAISVFKGVQSTVSSAIYSMGSEWPAPSAVDPTNLDIQLQLPVPAIP